MNSMKVPGWFVPIAKLRVFHPDFEEYRKMSPMKADFFLYQVFFWLQDPENKSKKLIIGYKAV